MDFNNQKTYCQKPLQSQNIKKKIDFRQFSSKKLTFDNSPQELEEGKEDDKSTGMSQQCMSVESYSLLNACTNKDELHINQEMIDPSDIEKSIQDFKFEQICIEFSNKNTLKGVNNANNQIISNNNKIIQEINNHHNYYQKSQNLRYDTNNFNQQL
ncbi:hypothetical protein PPERSA_01734 [Pseudocohnilembus persalinus]|uniref:Uncharacterized protein n=1 Tax=Pseudocohnilembus persalinus TaxID=266149 RepID=A0A0V0R1A8_PSEPJ|nr:hypothetical protein PPERSA_01734 [Pseudocohnilembus persalinus]|eukprot:KRX08273.1 hypothetical protein PPERSA_01734 [Pseudocohnilembus persalinus]